MKIDPLGLSIRLGSPDRILTKQVISDQTQTGTEERKRTGGHLLVASYKVTRSENFGALMPSGKVGKVGFDLFLGVG